MEDAGWVSVKDSCFAGEGFLLTESAGKREGWLVWLASDKADRDEWESARLSLVSYRYQIDLSSENPTVESPKTDKSVIGGIYVVRLSYYRNWAKVFHERCCDAGNALNANRILLGIVFELAFPIMYVLKKGMTTIRSVGVLGNIR